MVLFLSICVLGSFKILLEQQQLSNKSGYKVGISRLWEDVPKRVCSCYMVI